MASGPEQLLLLPTELTTPRSASIFSLKNKHMGLFFVVNMQLVLFAPHLPGAAAISVCVCVCASSVGVQIQYEAPFCSQI